MPASMVKTKRDEKLWTQAKDRAAAEGHEGDWPYVVGIFQRMKRGTAKGAHLPGMLLLPEGYGRRLWGLLKGAGHRYIKRVPIPGKVTKTGKPRYRYYYDVAHGGGVASHEHMVEGASFKHGEGHFHIHKVDGDTLHIKHDETGETHTISKRDLAKKLEGAHAEALKAARDKAAARVKEAEGSGANARQVARLKEHAARIGAQGPEAKPAATPKPVAPTPEHLKEVEQTHAKLIAAREALDAAEKKVATTVGGEHRKAKNELKRAMSEHSGILDRYAEHSEEHRGELRELQRQRRRDASEPVTASELNEAANVYGLATNGLHQALIDARANIRSGRYAPRDVRLVASAARSTTRHGDAAKEKLRKELQLLDRVSLMAPMSDEEGRAEESSAPVKAREKDGREWLAVVTDPKDPSRRTRDAAQSLERVAGEIERVKGDKELVSALRREAAAIHGEANEQDRAKRQRDAEAAKEKEAERARSKEDEELEAHAAEGRAALQYIAEHPASETAKAAFEAAKAKVKTTAPGAFKPAPVKHDRDAAMARAKVFSSTDVSRPSLMTTHSTGTGQIVATDGHRLAIIPTSHTKKETIDNRDGGHSFDTFPNYEKVIPSSTKSVATMDAAALRSALEAHIAHAKASVKGADSHTYLGGDALVSRPQVTFEHRDGRHSKRISNNRPDAKISAPVDGDFAGVHANTKYLLDALKGAKGTVRIGTTDQYSPIVIDREDGEKHIIMPLRREAPPITKGRMFGPIQAVLRGVFGDSGHSVLVRLPTAYGARMWALCKGAGHKYIKRVPIPGKTTKNGKPRYRYYYSVAHGGGIDAADHFVEGASFRHGDGHYHITKRDGAHITIRHDETGDTQTIGPRELADKLRTEHSDARKSEGDKIKQDWKDAHASGANPKQIDAIRRRASAVGAQLGYEQHMSKRDIRAAKMLDGVTMPPTKTAEVETSQKDGGRGKVKSKVAGVWAVAQNASREITHIPSGLSVSASVPEQNREALFAALAAKFPTWGADAKFGDTSSVGKDALAKLSAPVQDFAEAHHAVYEWNKAQEAMKADRAKAAADKVRASVQTKAPGAFTETPKLLSQQAAMDEAKSVASKDPTRAGLRAVHFDGKGHAYGTDGHRLIVVPTNHDQTETISTVDGQNESGEGFPNVHHFMQYANKNVKHYAHVDADALRSVMKAAMVTAHKRDKTGQSVQLRDGSWYVRDADRELKKIGETGHMGTIPENMTVNPKFVLDALRGAKGTVQIRTGTPEHPFIVDREDGIKQYIMPRAPRSVE